MNRIQLPPIRACVRGPSFAENTRLPCRNCWSLPLPVALLFVVLFGGCNNSCFTFISNLPAGTTGTKTSDPSPVCKPTTVNAAVRVQMDTEPVCSSCIGPAQVQHIFLSIRGIEVHQRTTADEDSPDWQELLPVETEKRPLQVDLVRGSTAWGAQELLGGLMAIPPGIYRQVRLRFVPSPSAPEDRLPERNACGGVGFNCVITADGRVRPLLLDRVSPELRITPDSIEGTSLLIPSGTEAVLLIELKPVWALFSSADEGVRLLPVLTGSVKVRRVDFDELGIQRGEGVHETDFGRRN